METPVGTRPSLAAVEPLAPLRRNRSFQLLWMGALFSTLGMEAASVAYPMAILALTGSPAQAGLFGVVAMLTTTMCALPAGDIVDRSDNRAVLLLADGSRLLAVASIALAVATESLAIGHVVVAAAVVGTAQMFGGTARLLLLRSVVPPVQLSSVLAREEVRSGSAQLAGPPLGGLLYGVSPASPFGLNAACLVIAFLCAFAVRPPRRERPAEPLVGSLGDRRGARRVFTGLTTLWRSRPLRGTVLIMVALNVATAPVPLITIVALTRQSATPAAIGLALGGLALGGLAGTALIKPLHHLRPGVLLLTVGAAEIVILSALALPLKPHWAMLILFVSMLPIPALRVAVDLLIFRRASEDSRGRTIAAVGAVLGIGFSIGVGLAALLLEQVGVVGALLVLLGLLAAVIAYLSAEPQLRTMRWPEEE